MLGRASLAKFKQHRIMSPSRASLVAQMLKNPPAMQETWVQSLGQEDPLEKGIATMKIKYPLPYQ